YTIRDGERQIAMSSGPVACDCADCDSALGTPAYLADLLEFTTRAATKNGDELTLQPLVDNLYQPFEELPATCAAAQPDVTQARIAVEVLTQHVSQSTLDSLIAPDDVGGTYRRAVYEALLEEHGTSFAELREVLAGSDDEQERLAARLGISKRDLEDLLLDPTADPTASDAVSPAALEEIFGYEAIVEVTQGSSGPTVSVLDPLRSRDTPKLQEWRESELWLQWNGTDHPSDPIASSSVPIVDPDVVGPDDFRDPTSGTVHWDLWTKRRSWLDDTIADFRSKGSIADLFAAMRSNFDYDGTQRAPAWLGGATASTLEDHYRTLQGRPGASGTPEASREYVTDRLRLPVEAFMHLMEIREEVPAGQSKPDEDEWRDVCSILAGARKRSLFGAWEAAEHSAGFELGPKQFWPSLREPDTGRWSGVLDDDHASTPFVDPDHVDRDDLRERPHGEAILTLYEQRRQTLADQPAAFRQTYEADDVDTVLDDVYGSVPDGTDWESYLDGLAASLRATDPSTVETAETTIEGTLHLDLDAFEAVHAVRDADAAGETPDSDELGAAFAALVTPWKREQRYADWVTAEGQAVSGSRTYWKLLRARLPEWRTATEDRRVWRDGLAARREPPVVDPDMVRPDIFEPFTRGNPAKEVWRRMQNFTQVGRGPDLESEVTSIETRWQGASDPLQAFDDLLDSYVGIAGQTLTDLAGRRAGGAIIEGRLDQLDLTPAGFEYLAERRDRLDGGPGLTDEEWHNVTSILVAVWKRRQHAEWHEEEVNRGVSLRPELFRLPEGDLVPDDVPEHVERWRIDGERVRDWVDRLEERIETLDDVEGAIRDAVHAVEESELPGLRDDLIREAHPNADLATKADELTERLLMPMRNDGCRRTSRIAQAVGSVQRLLLALRNGEEVAGSAIELQLEADAYDEAWTWLESHEKWRSAMKTFLYPENILQGTHRRGEVTTPLFAELVEDLRDPGLTPSDACRAAERYTAYIKDLASIHVEASCWAPVPAGDAPGDCDVTPEGQPRELFYMFGVGGETGRVYWARYDPQARGWQEDENWAEHHDHPLTFWQPLEAEDHGLGDVEGIVGVDRHGGEPYLVLSTAARGGRQLAIVRFDPIDDAIASAAPLSVPDHAGGFSAAVVQRPAGGVGPPSVVLAVPDDEGTQLHATDDDIIFSEGRRSFMYYENQIAGPGGGWQRGSWNRLLVFGRRLAQDAQLDLASAIEVDGRLVLFTNLPRPDRPRLTETDVVSITPESRAADFPDRVQGRLDQFRDYNKKRQQLEVARLGRDRTQSEYDRAERRVSSLENQLERQLNTLESRLSDIHTVHDFSIPPGPVEDTLKDRSKSVDDLGDLLEVFIGSNGAYDGPPKAIVQAWVEGILSLPEDKQPRVGGQSLEDFLSGLVAIADSLRQAYDARDSVSDRLERARESVQRHQRELEETAGYRLVEGFNEWRKGVTLTRSHPLGHVQATIYRPEYGTDQMTGLFVVSSTGPPEDRTTFVHLVRSVGEDMFDNIVRQDYNVPRDMSLVDVATHGGPTMADGYGFVVAELDGPNHFGGPMVHSLGDTSPFGTLVYRSVAPQVPSPPPTETPKLKWKAHGDGALPVSKGFDAERQASRREWIDGVGCHNGHRIETVFYLKTNQIYLWEAYFFLPMLLGRRLQRAGQYNEALDWFRTVYDYTLPEDDRKIFHRLHREEYYGEISSPKPGWLGDDVGPHVIAAGRTHAYTRFTVFSIVQCLLDHADAEFGHSATESIARARDRYLQAEDLLEVPAVDRSGQPCRDVGIEVETNVQLSVDLGDYLEAYWIDQLQQLVATMDSYVLRKTATQKIQAALDGEEDPEVRLEQARSDVLELGEGGDATVGNGLDGSAEFRRRLQDAVVADD
ncbi:MAG: neuraminidase-like domain-containing protein, partial [Halobacteriales archaeon]